MVGWLSAILCVEDEQATTFSICVLGFVAALDCELSWVVHGNNVSI